MIGDMELMARLVLTRREPRESVLAAETRTRLRWRLPWVRVKEDVKPEVILLDCRFPAGADTYDYQTDEPIEGDGIRWSGFSIRQLVDRSDHQFAAAGIEEQWSEVDDWYDE